MYMYMYSLETILRNKRWNFPPYQLLLHEILVDYNLA
jgi:hypothetical protein